MANTTSQMKVNGVTYTIMDKTARDGITQEVSDRNTAIDSAITQEVSDRNNAIDSAISTEVTNRNDAISSAISTEVTNRNDAISSAISTEVTNRNNAIDSAITSAISTEVTNRNNAIDSAITQEVSDRNNAIDSAISTEVTNRNDAISSAISTEVTNRNDAISSAISTEVTNRNNAIDSAIAQEVADRNNAIANAKADIEDKIIDDAVLNGLTFEAVWENASIHDFDFRLPANTPIKVSFINTTVESVTGVAVYGVKTDETRYVLGTVPLGEERTFTTKYTNDSIRLVADPYAGSMHGTIACNVQISSVTKSLLQITDQKHVSFSYTRTVYEKKDVSAGEKYRIYVWNITGDASAAITVFVFKTDNTYTSIPYEVIGDTQYYEATMPADVSYIRLYANVGTPGTQLSFDYAFVKVGGGVLDVMDNRILLARAITDSLIDVTDQKKLTFSYNRTIFEKYDIAPGDTYRIYIWTQSQDANAEVTVYLYKTDTTYELMTKEVVSGVQYYEVTMPSDADHLRLYGSVGTAGTPLTCEYVIVKVGGRILDVLEAKSDTDEALLFATRSSKLCKIFKKVCCCGDSYTAGYIDIGSGSSNNPEFSWPHYMATATGNEYVNCGVSGANVFVWMANANGLAKAQTSGKAQLYIIDLIRNDASESERHIDVGSVTDIGTDAQTYYGGMSKLIRELNAINPTAKIFVNCIPSAYVGFRDYNTAIRTIVETYKDTYPVHCIDLEQFREYYVTGPYREDYIHGHETAIGYEVFAELYEAITSKYISENVSDFQDVYTIPYE